MNARQFYNLSLRSRADHHLRLAVLCFVGTAACWGLSIGAAAAHSANGCIGLALLGVFSGIVGFNHTHDRRIALDRIDSDPRL